MIAMLPQHNRLTYHRHHVIPLLRYRQFTLNTMSNTEIQGANIKQRTTKTRPIIASLIGPYQMSRWSFTYQVNIVLCNHGLFIRISYMKVF